MKARCSTPRGDVNRRDWGQESWDVLAGALETLFSPAKASVKRLATSSAGDAFAVD